jgi:hypothetical protein
MNFMASFVSVASVGHAFPLHHSAKFALVRYHPKLCEMDRPMLRAPSESVPLLYWTSQKYTAAITIRKIPSIRIAFPLHHQRRLLLKASWNSV